MRVALYVVGFRPPDAEWQRMKAAYDACEAAKVDPPKEIQEFFNYEKPDAAGVEVKLGNDCDSKSRHVSVGDFSENGYQGFTVDLAKLPDGLRYIRFYVSY